MKGVQPYIRRWQALWATSGRRVLLGEVLEEPDPAGGEDPDPPALLPHERLQAHWAEHFAYTPVDVRLAQALTRRFGLTDVNVGELPTAELVQLRLRRCRRSAPGPDGIPHLAWRSAGRLGAHVIARALHAILAGGKPGRTMNSKYLICIPKGVRPEEGSVIARAASQTRPLGLKNTDVKVMASCVARSGNPGLEFRQMLLKSCGGSWLQAGRARTPGCLATLAPPQERHQWRRPYTPASTGAAARLFGALCSGSRLH